MYIQQNQTQKQPRFFLGDLADGFLSQICIEVWAEGSPWGGRGGRWAYLMSLLRDVQRVQCKDSFPGAHVQSVFVLTHQQGRVVKDAWLMKLHQAYLCGQQRREGKQEPRNHYIACTHSGLIPWGQQQPGHIANCVILLHHGVVLRKLTYLLTRNPQQQFYLVCAGPIFFPHHPLKKSQNGWTHVSPQQFPVMPITSRDKGHSFCSCSSFRNAVTRDGHKQSSCFCLL